MIGLTPLDAVLDAFGAQFCGSVIMLLFGSLRGVIVIAGTLVLAYALFTLAVGLDIREALARVLKLGVVIWVFGWMVPTDVSVWMSSNAGRAPTSLTSRAGMASGHTSGWLNAIVTVLDVVTVELLDLVKGLGSSSSNLTSQSAFVYGLSAVTQATTFDIQDPRMRDGVQQFLELCLPRAYEDIAAGRATSFFDWIANNGSAPIVTASEAAIRLPGPGGQTFDGLTTCRQMHDVLEQTYVESYARDRGAHFSDPSQAVNQEAIATAALQNGGYTGGEPVAGLAWRRWLTMALNAVRTANGLNPMALGAMKATEWVTGADLGVLYQPARATGRGEALAGLTLGIVGWFDRVLDGAFTTKMMAITLPLVLAVVRCLLYILFPFAWLSLGIAKDGTPFRLWLGAVAWTKAQYVVMALMVELELFLGRTFQILKEMPFGAFPFESIDRMESALSLVFAIATVVGMAVTAAIFFRAAGPMTTAGRAAASAVLGSAATLGILASRAAGAAGGGARLSGASSPGSASPGAGTGGPGPSGPVPSGPASSGTTGRGSGATVAGTTTSGGFRVSVSWANSGGPSQGWGSPALRLGGGAGSLPPAPESGASGGAGSRALPPAPSSGSGGVVIGVSGSSCGPASSPANAAGASSASAPISGPTSVAPRALPVTTGASPSAAPPPWAPAATSSELRPSRPELERSTGTGHRMPRHPHSTEPE